MVSLAYFITLCRFSWKGKEEEGSRTNIRRSKVLICASKGAVLAVLGSILIIQPPRCDLEVSTHILSTGLSRRRVKHAHFRIRAHNRSAMETRRRKTRDKIRQRGNAVHEDPEPRQSIGWLHNTVEDKGHHEHQGCDCATCFCVGEGGDDECRECRCEDKELDCKEEHQTLSVRGLVGAIDGEVVASPGDDTGEDLPGYFNKDVGDYEGGPRICF